MPRCFRTSATGNESRAGQVYIKDREIDLLIARKDNRLVQVIDRTCNPVPHFHQQIRQMQGNKELILYDQNLVCWTRCHYCHPRTPVLRAWAHL